MATGRESDQESFLFESEVISHLQSLIKIIHSMYFFLPVALLSFVCFSVQLARSLLGLLTITLAQLHKLTAATLCVLVCDKSLNTTYTRHVPS